MFAQVSNCNPKNHYNVVTVFFSISESIVRIIWTMEEYNHHETHNHMIIVSILIAALTKFHPVKIMDNVVVVKWNSESFNNRA